MEVSERPIDEDEIVACPLCPDELYLKTLRIHLSKHLEEIALHALPLFDDDEGDDEDDDADSRRAIGNEVISDIDLETNGSSSKTSSRMLDDASHSTGESLIDDSDGGPIQSLPNDEVHSELRVPTLPLYSISVSTIPKLYGRDDVLKIIDDHFKSPDDGFIRSIALRGLGGIGKTAVASEYAHRCKNSNAYDAIFWIRADSRRRLNEEFRQMAIGLGLIPEGKRSFLEANFFVHILDWLFDPVKESTDQEEKSRASWLIVFDGFEDPNILSDILKELRRTKGHGCVLITTRCSLDTSPRKLVEIVIDLNPLSIEHSCQMAKELTGMEGDVRMVGETLGGLPLALMQLANTKRRLTYLKDVTPPYHERDRDWSYQDLFPENMAAQITARLSDFWGIERLRRGRVLLEVMSFMDPSNIQEWVLKNDVSDLLNDYPFMKNHYASARKKLLQGSLISRDASRRCLKMHRIVQDTIRPRLGTSHHLLVFSAALKLVLLSWHFEGGVWSYDGARYMTCQEVLPHIIRMKNLHSERIQSLTSIEIQTDYCRLIIDAGRCVRISQYRISETEGSRYCLERGNLRMAKSLMENAESKLGPLSVSDLDDATLIQRIRLRANAHYYLGRICAESNQPEASFHFGSFEELMNLKVGTSLKVDKPSARVSYGVGTGCMMDRKWAEAGDHFLKSIRRALQNEAFDLVERFSLYIDLGLTYWLSQQFRSASDHLKTVLVDHERLITNDGKRLYM